MPKAKPGFNTVWTTNLVPAWNPHPARVNAQEGPHVTTELRCKVPQQKTTQRASVPDVPSTMRSLLDTWLAAAPLPTMELCICLVRYHSRSRQRNGIITHGTPYMVLMLYTSSMPIHTKERLALTWFVYQRSTYRKRQPHTLTHTSPISTATTSYTDLVIWTSSGACFQLHTR